MTTLVVRGQVKDQKGVQTQWMGYHAVASFQQMVDVADGNRVPTPSELFADVGLDGAFSLTLPDPASVSSTDPITVRIVAPAGEQLGSQDFTLSALQAAASASTVETFSVVPQAAFDIQPGNPFQTGNPKVTGRVLDVTGDRLVANRQVIILGVARDGVSTTPSAVVVARTDPQGYFSADYPRTTDLDGNPLDPVQLKQAWAVVAGTRDIGGAAQIPVPLVDVETWSGLLPRNVVLVVRVDEDPSADVSQTDCACSTDVPRAPDATDLTRSPSTYSMDLGGGRCVNLTTPNRAVEEFSFFTVVRTTDPQIMGIGDVERTSSVPAPILNSIRTRMAAADGDGNAGAGGVNAAPTMVMERLAIGRATGGSGNGGTASAGGETGVLATTVDPRILARHLGSTTMQKTDVLKTAEAQTASIAQLAVLRSLWTRAPSRAALTADNPIEWDSDEPRFYEATTIAHGHLLHFKQVWRADGYSLGDLLYSLPLAPAQKKQIAIVDWERRETGARTESLSESESLQNLVSRDRDITEIVSSTLNEHMHGNSAALTGGYGQGQGAAGSGSYQGFNFGGVVASAFGIGGSAAEASQDSSRTLAANALQSIRDTTLQSASAVRNQRSTVIQTVTQGESVSVTTEVVANHNHCHAMTVEYFEVLRHFQVTQELSDVQECLFVPLLMSPFDERKTLRWRDLLQTFLRRPELAGGFDAIDRIVSNYADADYPTGIFADEQLLELEGVLSVEVRMPTGGDQGVFAKGWDAFTNWLVGSDAQPDKNKTALQIELVSPSGDRKQVPMQFTLVSELQDRTPLYVRMTQSGSWSSAPNRSAVDKVHLYWEMKNSDFPDGTQLLVRSGSMRYRTAHLRNHVLFDQPHIDSGLSQPEAWVDTPLDAEEQRDPRKEDAKLARKLLAHLNEHIEYYHKAIWWSMDPDRRFMLLDGFVAPNANGRSVASVVENRLIGFVGNSMVFPVGPGIHLDPSYTQDAKNRVDLIDLYAPTTPIPPMRVSIPTRGVFAEAVMGACNSCEPMEETRFWRWDQAPTGDEPAPIQSPSTGTRATPDPNLQPQPFPTPMINLQNAPTEPDPTGLAAALKVIGTPNLFPNITGLDQTQKNSLAAMQAALDAAKHFGDQAAALVQQQAMQKGGIDKSLQSIQNAKGQGLINDAQANDLSVKALQGLVGGVQGAAGGAQDKPNSIDQLTPSLKNQLEKGGVKTIKTNTAAGDNLEAEFAQPELILASTSTTGKASSATIPIPPAAVAQLPLGVDFYSGNTNNGAYLGLADFQTMKARGKVFAIAKVAQNTTDGGFPTSYPAIRQAGLIRGSFDFFAPIAVATQVTMVTNAVKRLLPGDLAPAVDMEDDSQVLKNKYNYGTTAGTKALLDDVQAWADGVETALGRTPLVYTGNVWRDDLKSTRMSEYPLWTAHPQYYTANAAATGQVFGGWKAYTIWQYGEDTQGKKKKGEPSKLWGIDPYKEPGLEAYSGLDYDAFGGTMYGLRGLADIGRPSPFIASNGTFIAHSELDGHLHLLVGLADVWTDNDLSNDLGGSGDDPVLVVTSTDMFVYFRSSGKLMEATAGTGSNWAWTTTDLSALAAIDAVHDPRVVFDGGKRYVVFWGDDDDWHLMTFDGGWSHDGLLTTAKLGSASGQPVPYVSQGLVHVVGRVDADGHLFEVFADGNGGWSSLDVTASAQTSTPAVPAATYSPCVYETNGGVDIVFRGLQGDLWLIARASGAATNLTTAASTVHAAGHPSCFVLQDVPHVIFRGVDGSVYDLWPTSGGWKAQTVCDEAAVADPVATTDGSSSALVAFRTSSGMIDAARFDGSNWTCTPTKRATVEVPAPAPDGGGTNDGTILV